MAVPSTMTTSTLNALKGWPRPNAVDFRALFDASIEVVVPEGSVVHVGAAGTYLLGVGNSAVMPLFNFQASDDPDISNYGGDAATDSGNWVGINPSGNAMALVAIGAYELVSTNYNANLTYNPNTHLTSPLTTGGGVNAGQLTIGTLGTDTIVGVVSRGVVDNGYGTDALAFWPVYIPPQ